MTIFIWRVFERSSSCWIVYNFVHSMLPILEMTSYIMFHDFSINIRQRCLQPLKPVRVKRSVPSSYFEQFQHLTSFIRMTQNLETRYGVSFRCRIITLTLFCRSFLSHRNFVSLWSLAWHIWSRPTAKLVSNNVCLLLMIPTLLNERSSLMYSLELLVKGLFLTR